MSCKISFLPNNVSYLSVNGPEVGVGKTEFFDLAGPAFQKWCSKTYSSNLPFVMSQSALLPLTGCWQHSHPDVPPFWEAANRRLK